MYFFHGPLLAIKGDVWTQKVVHISQFSKLLFRRRKKRKKILVMIFFWGSPALRMHFSLLQLFLCILDSDWQDAVINYALWFGPRFPQKLFFTKGLQMLSQPFCPLYTFIIYVHVLLAPEGALGRPMTNWASHPEFPIPTYSSTTPGKAQNGSRKK